MAEIDDILARIDLVLRRNRRTELLFVGLTTILFACGITCLLGAILSGQYVLASPSAVTTVFLYWPLREIRDIRRKNIALSIAPMLIMTLSRTTAEVEIRKLLTHLYGEK